MTYFTVYYGNNEAMMFNAECTTGSLVSRMIELLAPHTSGYTRLELLPINFVLEQFKPPTSSNAASRGGQSSHDATSDTAAGAGVAQPGTLRSQPFTGMIPFVGLATRAVESYADAVLGGVTTAVSFALPASTSASSHSASAGGTSASAACGAAPIMPSPLLQNAYVLLGCRYHPHHQPQPPAPCERFSAVAALNLPTPNLTGNKTTPMSPRKTYIGDGFTTQQQLATLHRAQIIAAAPIVAVPLNRGSVCSTTAPSGLAAAAFAQGGSPIADTGMLLVHNNGLSLSGDSSAVWRRNFSNYLTTLLLPQAGEAPGNAAAAATVLTGDAERQKETKTTMDNSQGDTDTVVNAVLLPSAATGLFKTPMPPIAGYDVLWRGTRGEHIRLQDALDERVFTDTDPKKKKSKKK
ncbi:hypothetical protein TraAM80_05253 [Trypanosoma rangeli]|uniref:Uncharacterized protein n=1 Tax=Trypanosoma rangeli TaxID=5698 RepID=A0A422NFY1_TRYRA|nr:uncharacterized protein TraAM80_05253 [Trypanosoma rangeli]RNF04375.1 hypothetical protein TraAM80_05253 [Trypanosoma rangeli]|eukprot:RNF04375.1 hypothetical protein TraAM80_05253 [Trypanosoma rangeli]